MNSSVDISSYRDQHFKVGINSGFPSEIKLFPGIYILKWKKIEVHENEYIIINYYIFRDREVNKKNY